MSSATMATLSKFHCGLLMIVTVMSCAAVLMGAACSAADEAPGAPAGAPVRSAASTTSDGNSGSIRSDFPAAPVLRPRPAAPLLTGTAATRRPAGKGDGPQHVCFSLSGDIPIDGSSTVFRSRKRLPKSSAG